MSYLVTFNQYEELFNIFEPQTHTVSANDLNSFLEDLVARKWSNDGDEMITSIKVYALVDMEYGKNGVR